MESMDRQWNCRCAPIKRGRVFPLQADSIWKRLPHSDYCHGHANRSTTRPADVCVLGPAPPWAIMFRNRSANLDCPVCIAARRYQYCALSKRTDCNSAKTVPTKICASMRSRSRSRSSDTQIVPRRNFRCGSNSRCLPIRLSRKSSLIAL